MEMPVMDHGIRRRTTARMHAGLREQLVDTASERMRFHDSPLKQAHGDRNEKPQPPLNKPRYAGAIFGSSTSAGTSTVWVPSA